MSIIFFSYEVRELYYGSSVALAEHEHQRGDAVAYQPAGGGEGGDGDEDSRI